MVGFYLWEIVLDRKSLIFYSKVESRENEVIIRWEVNRVSVIDVFCGFLIYWYWSVFFLVLFVNIIRYGVDVKKKRFYNLWGI